MKILTLEYKNFNSYGNKLTKIDFKDEGSMIMLIGQSGHGKSSIREVISFLIYGKVQDKKLGDLPNRINKSLWGKITVFANKSTIEIERGVSPKVFNVTINGKPQETAGNSNIQKILENDYFKIPQSTFDNVISISIDKFKSFLTMKPADKRKILDQIFGILFFNKIHDSLKNFVKIHNDEVNNLNGQVNILMDNKKQIQDKIKKIEDEKSRDTTEKLEEIVSQIDSLTTSLTKLSKEESTISEKSKLVEDKIFELNKKHSELGFKIKDCKHKLKVYDNDKCPQCNSDLTDQVHLEYKEEIENNKGEYEKELKTTKESIKKLKEASSLITNKARKINDEVYEIRLSLDKLKSTKDELSKPIDDDNEFQDVLNNTINKIEELLNNIEENKKKEYLYNELCKIFSDDGGVKSQITRNFLPGFNKSINEFGKKLHFPYKIEIDEKFNSRVISIGEEISPKTLSTGERRKANFAVLVSLIRIMKRNYPNINLLFLDEILASIDSYAIYEMLNLIRQIVDELDLNVFTINHSELPKEMFDSVYSVNKVAGFSELTIEEC